ncbi:MAG TPA: hypothetical protein PLS70_04745 [Acidobacteriota bacterium]|nr:hypothetical protein [Acidobacteriota bacterium]
MTPLYYHLCKETTMGRNEATNTLMCGDLEIGQLEVCGVDNFWTYGRFHPLPGYARYSDLFGLLETAWSRSEPAVTDSDDVFEIQDKVNLLELQVRTQTGILHRIRDFKIQNGQYEYKLDLGEILT